MYKMKNQMTWEEVVDWLGDYLSEDEFNILTYGMGDLDLVGWLAEIKVTIRRLVMLWEYQWGNELVADEGCKVCGGNGYTSRRFYPTLLQGYRWVPPTNYPPCECTIIPFVRKDLRNWLLKD